jgi:hypothetical protein
MKTCLILLILTLTSAIPTKADPMTAGELAAECRLHADGGTPQTLLESLSTGHCQGYVQAWMEMSVIRTVGGPDQIVVLSWKDGVKVGQVIRVFCLFIKQHPEKENELAVAKLLEAMSDANLVEFKPWKPKGA